MTTELGIWIKGEKTETDKIPSVGQLFFFTEMSNSFFNISLAKFMEQNYFFPDRQIKMLNKIQMIISR